MTYFVPACVIGFVVLGYLVLKDIAHQYRELSRTLDALAEVVKRHGERIEWVNSKADALAEDFDRSQMHREMLDPMRYEPSAN